MSGSNQFTVGQSLVVTGQTSSQFNLLSLSNIINSAAVSAKAKLSYITGEKAQLVLLICSTCKC